VACRTDIDDGVGVMSSKRRLALGHGLEGVPTDRAQPWTQAEGIHRGLGVLHHVRQVEHHPGEVVVTLQRLSLHGSVRATTVTWLSADVRSRLPKR
jgi:hypothetical protein